MYEIRLTHKVTGNTYYFARFLPSGVPRSVSRLNRKLCARFPSVRDACAVVREINPNQYHALIVRVKQ